MEELIKEWTTILQSGGPFVFLTILGWYHLKKEKDHKAEVADIRTGYQEVIAEKDDLIKEKDEKIEGILKGQVEALGDNISHMVEALTRVEAVMSRLEARL